MRGEIFDVVVDLRKNSKTFCKCFSIILKDSDHIQIYMPPGFAHGFCVLSEIADIHYKVSQYYNPDHEAGIIWNDSKLSIRWPLKNPIITQRDSLFPQIQDIDILNLPL